MERKCPHCDGSDLNRHGTYEGRNGEEVRRWYCKHCGRTHSDHVDRPSYRLRTGKERVTADGREVSRYLAFFYELRSRYLSSGIKPAIEKARAEVGVPASTASRWIHKGDLLTVGKAISDVWGFGGVTHRWRLLTRCLQRYRRSLRPSERKKLVQEEWLVVDEAYTVLQAIQRARAIATPLLVGRGVQEQPKPPSWLDRLVIWDDILRSPLSDSSWKRQRNAQPEPEEVLDELGVPKELRQPLEPRGRDRRAFLWMLTTLGGEDREEADYVRPGSNDRWDLWEVVFRAIRLRNPFYPTPDWDLLRSNSRLDEEGPLAALAKQEHLSATEGEDKKLDRSEEQGWSLDYWIWKSGSEEGKHLVHVAVATPGSIVGHACAKVKPDSYEGAMPVGDARRLLVHDRTERWRESFPHEALATYHTSWSRSVTAAGGYTRRHYDNRAVAVEVPLSRGDESVSFWSARPYRSDLPHLARSRVPAHQLPESDDRRPRQPDQLTLAFTSGEEATE